MTTENKVNKEEKIYELGYHIISSIAEENVPVEVSKVKEILAKENAVIISEETPKLRPLAYEIKKAFNGQYKKFTDAYFGFIKFELSEDADVNNIDKKLKSLESVLRFILIKTVRENTMYSPKFSIFKGGEDKIKNVTKKEKVENPASIEEIDASIDALVKEEATV